MRFTTNKSAEPVVVLSLIDTDDGAVKLVGGCNGIEKTLGYFEQGKLELVELSANFIRQGSLENTRDMVLKVKKQEEDLF